MADHVSTSWIFAGCVHISHASLGAAGLPGLGIGNVATLRRSHLWSRRKEETMRRNEKPTNDSERNGTRLLRPRPGGSKRQSLRPASPTRGGERLKFPPGPPDIEALRSVTREWLVPRLVEKFLRIHGVELKHSPKFANAANRLQPSLVGEGSLIAAGPPR